MSRNETHPGSAHEPDVPRRPECRCSTRNTRETRKEQEPACRQSLIRIFDGSTDPATLRDLPGIRDLSPVTPLHPLHDMRPRRVLVNCPSGETRVQSTPDFIAANVRRATRPPKSARRPMPRYACHCLSEQRIDRCRACNLGKTFLDTWSVSACGLSADQ